MITPKPAFGMGAAPQAFVTGGLGVFLKKVISIVLPKLDFQFTSGRSYRTETHSRSNILVTIRQSSRPMSHSVSTQMVTSGRFGTAFSRSVSDILVSHSSSFDSEKHSRSYITHSRSRTYKPRR